MGRRRVGEAKLFLRWERWNATFPCPVKFINMGKNTEERKYMAIFIQLHNQKENVFVIN